MISDFLIASNQANTFMFELDDHPVFRVSGADSQRYLQGRITQDISSLAAGEAVKSLILNPQGKILGQFFLLKNADDFLLFSDKLAPESIPQFISDLLQFKVADRIEVEHLTDKTLVTIQGKNALKCLQNADIEEVGDKLFSHTVDHQEGEITVLNNPRGEKTGFDLLVEKEKKSIISPVFGASADLTGTEKDYEAFRICRGIPQMQSEFALRAIPPEFDLSNVVSFSKGCYAGQEVVEMAIARGKPPRKLHLFSFSLEEVVDKKHSEEYLTNQLDPEKTPIFQQPNGDKPCGQITASVCFFEKKHRVWSRVYQVYS